MSHIPRSYHLIWLTQQSQLDQVNSLVDVQIGSSAAFLQDEHQWWTLQAVYEVYTMISATMNLSGGYPYF